MERSSREFFSSPQILQQYLPQLQLSSCKASNKLYCYTVSPPFLLSVPGLHKSKSGIKKRMHTKNMLQFYGSGLTHSPWLILPTQCSRHTLKHHTTVFIWTRCGHYLLRVCTVSFLVFFSISCFAALWASYSRLLRSFSSAFSRFLSSLS